MSFRINNHPFGSLLQVWWTKYRLTQKIKQAFQSKKITWFTRSKKKLFYKKIYNKKFKTIIQDWVCDFTDHFFKKCSILSIIFLFKKWP